MEDFFQIVVNRSAASPLLACGEQFGLRLPDAAEIAEVHALAAELIGGRIASTATLARVHAACPGALLVHAKGGELDGLLATLPLHESGRAALLRGDLDSLDPDVALLARGEEAPAAVYAWGCAARSRVAARAVMGASAALPAAYPATSFYARAATDAGRRALTGSLGYRPDRVRPDLLCRDELRRAA